jgi:biopolymer transport protein ExbB
VTFLAEALYETWNAGGFVMPYLVASAIVLWYAIGDRFWGLRRGTRAALDDVLAGDATPSDGVIGESLRNIAEVPPAERSRDRVREVLAPLRDQVGRHQMLIITIATLAPLMGLLGTVTGMIETFDSLTSMSMHSSTGGIAGGISEALVSTQMGLAVAVPALLVGRLMDTRQSQLEDELERIQDAMCRQAQGA